MLSKTRLALAAILLLALGLRLWGIDFGLPYEYHVDEVQYVRQAASLVETRLEPVWWNNPPFYKYIYLAEYGVLFVIGRVIGLYASIGDFAAKNSLDPTLLYLIGRATTAVFGMLTVALVYWLGRCAYNERVGVMASALLGASFIHVRESHFAVNDVAATFFVTLALLAAVLIAQTGQRKWYIIAGVALGLGFSTKYSAAFGAIPIVLGHAHSPNVRWTKRPQIGMRHLVLLLGVGAMSAVISSPYFLLTPAKVVKDVYEALYLPGRSGFEGWLIDPAGGYVFYPKTLVWGLGWPLFAAVIVGLLAAVLRHFPKDVVILSLPIAIFLIAGRQEMFFARFILPAVPALLILAAAVAEKVVSTLFVRTRAAAVATAVLTLLLVTPSLLSDVRFDHLLSQTDTRTLAKEWVEANVPVGSKIALDWQTHGPPLAAGDRAVPGAHREFDVHIVGGTGLSEHSTAWYRENGFDYLISSSFISDISLTVPEQDQARRAFYASLPEELELVRTIDPTATGVDAPFIFDEIYGPAVSLWRRERPGPTIGIYRIQP